MDFTELNDLDIVEDIWLSNIAAESSRIQYRYALESFCEFTDLDPEELLSLGREHIVAVRTLLNEWWEFHVEDEGLSTSRGSQLESAIKSFYSWNGIKVKTANRKVSRKYRRQLFTKSMIKKCIHFAEPMWAKYFVMVTWYTGMRLGDVRRIKLGTILDMVQQFDTFPRAHTRYFVYEYTAEKKGNECRAMFGPELIQQLKKYIEWLQEEGIPLDDHIPLFTTRRKGKIKRVSKRTIVHVMHETVIKAGLITREKLDEFVKFNPLGLHAIRASYGTYIDDIAEISTVEKKILMAHKPKSVESAYSLVSNAKLIKLYQFLEPKLLLYTAEKELEQKEQELQELRSEMSDQKEFMEEVRGFMENFPDFKEILELYKQKKDKIHDALEDHS